MAMENVKESKDILFVEVHQSDEVRRNILESLKDIVENLQRFEKFKETRKEKIENINKLGKIIKDINKIIPNLKNSLPETKIRAVSKSKASARKKVIVKEKRSPEEVAKRKPVTELQKLESELGDIESKLQGLR
ncbi:MAG: hypothetical protein IH934_07055 [Nanoarchaeota archaeon]|nr:hypothetical protein [Nanoarchaeota archaeon]